MVSVHLLNPNISNSVATEELGHDSNAGVPLAAVPAVTADLTLNEGSAAGNNELKGVVAGSGDSGVLQELVGEGANTGLGVLVVTPAAAGSAVIGLSYDSGDQEEGGGEEGKHVHGTLDLGAWAGFCLDFVTGDASSPRKGQIVNIHMFIWGELRG